ncbi:MAG: hypothetical protein JO166_05575 [Deltaproteobacteria bacterium]|nr:hypothetical protein [Deltaproteobacteria bacterium]
MPDDDDVMRVAADHLERRGPNAVPWLIEQAEIAEGAGHHEAAKVWREIAAAAKAILNSLSCLLAAAIGAAPDFLTLLSVSEHPPHQQLGAVLSRRLNRRRSTCSPSSASWFSSRSANRTTPSKNRITPASVKICPADPVDDFNDQPNAEDDVVRWTNSPMKLGMEPFHAPEHCNDHPPPVRTPPTPTFS